MILKYILLASSWDNCYYFSPDCRFAAFCGSI